MKHYLLFYYLNSHQPYCQHFSGYDEESVKRQAEHFISGLRVETTFELYEIDKPVGIWRTHNEIKEIKQTTSVYF